MNKNEIMQHVNLGRNKKICVDRRTLDKMPGYVREVCIQKNNTALIIFNNYGYDEGGVQFVGEFDSLEGCISFLESYIGINIQDWENHNKTGCYPENNIMVGCEPIGVEDFRRMIDDKDELIPPRAYFKLRNYPGLENCY